MTARRRSRSRQNRVWAGVVAGLGLILLAAAIALYARRMDTRSKAAEEVPAGPVQNPPAVVDLPAPELELTTLDGQPASLADYRGQVLIVNLWATWCPPCKAEMPDLLAYYEDHKDEGLALVAINIQEPAERVRPFVEAYGLTFPVWLDPKGTSTMAFRTQGLPSTFVIDPEGRIRLIWYGRTSRELLEQYVTPMLGQ
ncbi:MAG: TlpA family protein disulfide reductase [Chloroflexi bacterium]|nr:TlpA family protein disulfide reductase [Chloroflexota bacterium]